VSSSHQLRWVWGALCAVSLLAVVLGMALPLESRVGLRCGFLSLTGWPCLFCGMTRAFLAAGHGAWAEAFRQSPVGALLFPATAAFAVWSGWRVWRGRTPALRVPAGAWIALAVALLANWLYRLAAGLK